jgi:hypothetical protein
VKRKIRRWKVEGTQLGRRRLEDTDADKVAAIVAARAKGTGLRRIARELGVGVGTVLRGDRCGCVTGNKDKAASVGGLFHFVAGGARDRSPRHCSHAAVMHSLSTGHRKQTVDET